MTAERKPGRKPGRRPVADDAGGGRAPARAARSPVAVTDMSMIRPVDDDAAQALPRKAPPPLRPRRRLPLLRWLAAALGALVALGAGLAIDRLVRDLFARSDWLGWIALALAAIAAFSALALALREIWGLFRMAAIERLRRHARQADTENDPRKATAVIGELVRLYASRPDTARGRASLLAHEGEIIDGTDLIRMAERDLLASLDAGARRLVMDSAKRVSVVTAVSPRALVDVAYVLFENLRLIRRIAELYGGRPGTLGLWRLAGRVVTHLAATGAIAVGDGVIQQLVGHGLAARLSARLGEGVVNGMLTARIGIAAIDICRPIEFIHLARPGIGGFVAELSAGAAGPRQTTDDRPAADSGREER